MDAIRFNTVLGTDPVIRLPEGIAVPEGPCEVTVVPQPVQPAVGAEGLRPGSWEWLLALAADAEQSTAELPADMAENHDHYAHGKPRE